MINTWLMPAAKEMKIRLIARNGYGRTIHRPTIPLAVIVSVALEQQTGEPGNGFSVRK
jgi:hypothetical protein